MSKKALVLEGGGLRGIFTAGVIDCFLDEDIYFDYVIGVSAGSCNSFAFISRSRGFIKKCMLQEDKRNSFFGVQQMLESHKFVNLDKVFYDYTDQYNFDFDTFKNSKTKWEFVTTNINTGKPEYLSSDDIHMAQEMGRASCSMPILTDPVEINGQLYLDGGIADSVPLKHALDLGYDKVVVVCTRKKGNYSKVKDVEVPIYKSIYKNYPNFLDTVFSRNQLYKDQIELCERKSSESDDVLLIRPTLQEVGRLESDLEQLSLSYYHGYTKAKEFISKIKDWQ